MAEHHGQFRLTSMRRVLRVLRSGYYAWKVTPKSLRAQVDEALTKAIQQSFEDSDGIYGSHRDLREAGMLCGKKRVARLMQAAKLRSVRGYSGPATGQASLVWLHPIGCSASSRSGNPTRSGSPTSPTSVPMRGGCTWRW